MKYGCVKKQPVFIMEKATKALGKKGKVIIQSLKTGDTAIVNRKILKKVSSKYPESGRCN